ncbi:lipoprotein [Erwiniaceae bacterium BAC15a-03b]|uniref:Lipoprotein n=1 Tax=Winslowiella arboricola TaxID=2978220 RepID=A0A9J6PS12_9GAMM|nr:lipoprotein YedD [Winslowiella arboricola]MCU5773293.1 lipoprotein [Winslowiella arboricola]MCU5779179.1 lipoprotein [Winslowiella arboricola]
MKKWIVLCALALSGCTQITSYDQAVKTPAPADLQGVWQTVTPQSGLISEQAVASLIITPQGDTLDCRQWQRVIAKPGKLTVRSGDYVNVNRALRVMPLERKGTTLLYDKLEMQKMNHPTAECQQALDELPNQPTATTLQNIEPALMKVKKTTP